MKLLSKVALAVGTGIVLIAAGCSSSSTTPAAPAPAATPVAKFTTGDAVVAVWSGSSWYEGKINGTCQQNGANGFMVTWDDGSSPSCVEEAKIATKKTATKDDAKVGAAVFAKWNGSAFYGAKITKVTGEKYSVEYDDGFTKDGLALGDLRLK